MIVFGDEGIGCGMQENSGNYLLPTDRDLPLFVYGTLKPDELAHGQIENLVVDARPGTVSGFKLAVVDGIPYALSTGSQDSILGALLSVQAEAYERVSTYEQVPYLFRWREVKVSGTAANMLVSARTDITLSRHELRESWTIVDDTFMVDGMPWVHTKLGGIGEQEEARGRGAREGYLLIELQSIFMVLWTIFERILLFTQGVPRRDQGLRAKLDIAEQDPKWLAAIASSEIRDLRVRPHGSPDRRSDRGAGFCFREWATMRNNIVHRGKASYGEYSSLKRACEDMSKVLTTYLNTASPRLAAKWALDRTDSKS